MLLVNGVLRIVIRPHNRRELPLNAITQEGRQRKRISQVLEVKAQRTSFSSGLTGIRPAITFRFSPGSCKREIRSTSGRGFW